MEAGSVVAHEALLGRGWMSSSTPSTVRRLTTTAASWSETTVSWSARAADDSLARR